MSLSKIVKPETPPSLCDDSRKSIYLYEVFNIRFDVHLLLQAKQELEELLKAQMAPFQSSQSLESQLVSRGFSVYVFTEESSSGGSGEAVFNYFKTECRKYIQGERLDGCLLVHCSDLCCSGER